MTERYLYKCPNCGAKWRSNLSLNNFRCFCCGTKIEAGIIYEPPTPAGSPACTDKGSAQHKIVEAARRQREKEGSCPNDIKFLLTEFSCLIANEIEGLRKLFRNHEGRIKGIENRGCVTEKSGWVEDITEWRKESERKVESLEKKICDSTLLSGKPWRVQASPSQIIAQAPDEKGVMHPLIPGRSVVKDKYHPTDILLFVGVSGDRFLACWLTDASKKYPGGLGVMFSDPKDVFTFLFDLHFPGGDK